jgi:amino acid transporter
LSVAGAVTIVMGIVLGVGIFKTPSVVAANVGSGGLTLLVWLAGGVISFAGALCYAELASAYPDAGGEYHYLTRAFGPKPAFLFGWARMAVVQTGSLAMLAFVVGDYAAEEFQGASAGLAAATLVVFSGVNLWGLRPGSGLQKVLLGAMGGGLFIIMAAGLAGALPENEGAVRPAAGNPSLGKALVFVLLTYGGWNEAAYLSAEVAASRRSMVRVLAWSLGLITVIYLATNLAYLKGMGVEALSASEAVAADMLRHVAGEKGARFISVLIVLAAFGTINGCIITGARTNYALGRDFPVFRFLGRWDGRRGVPVNALLVQAAVALLLIAFGSAARSGFEAMVEYTAPVFWLFFFLVGLSLIVLRRKEPAAVRPFRVPFYPWTPLIFCAICLYMVWSSLVYAGPGALVGVVVLMAGIPLFLKNRRMSLAVKKETQQ